MKTLKNKINNAWNWIKENPKKGILYTALGLATLVGTFGGNGKDYFVYPFAPIYNQKSGTWGGINVSLGTRYQENSKFYGLSFSLIQLPEQSPDSSLPYVNDEFYGAKIGVINASNNSNGFEAGLMNASANLNGLKIGLINVSDNSNGLEIGILNISNHLKGMQLGCLNFNQNGYSPFIGLDFADEKK